MIGTLPLQIAAIVISKAHLFPVAMHCGNYLMQTSYNQWNKKISMSMAMSMTGTPALRSSRVIFSF